MGHPPAEVDVDEALVRSLLAEQLPERAEGRLTLVGHGWDNVIFRLDDDASVRVPRRAAAADLVLNEQRWLPLLAPRLPLPVPVPTFAGRPTATYPWHWSVCPWLRGERASVRPPHDLHEAATTLAELVNALHVPAPVDAPVNPVRGGPHADRLDRITRRIRDVAAAGRLPPDLDVDAFVDLWHRLAAAPAWDGPPLWMHGDLHGSNILTDDGRISAVIDFGDIGCGDPATDLAVAWVVLDAPARAHFRSLVDRDEATWTRARAWALSFAVFYLDSAPTDAALGRMGAHTLDQVLALPRSDAAP